jgi:hypothetical protein
MKFKKFTTGLFILALAVMATGFVIRGDDDPIQKIIAQLEKWIEERPQEKVYLQFDKPYYAVGDDIWFKAYITVGPEHKLSALSGALNVELINEQDSVKKWIKLPVTSGVTWGDFALSDTLQAGNYRVRAYTNWMRNAGEGYYFEKTIAIGNAGNNNVFTKATYSYSKVNNAQKVDASINFADLDGTPYALKEVNYAVRINEKQILKSKGQTDAQGNLVVSFINSTGAAVSSGSIITHIKVADKKTISKTISFNSVSGQVDVQFFPESGNLVNGIRSKVAFKAVGTNGLGVDIKGVVTDNNNNELAAINTRHLGMGAFALTPEAGKTYQAKITYPDGSQNTIALPKALDAGYVLTVNNTDTAHISVRVNSNNVNSKDAYLIAQSAGVVCYAARNKEGNSSFGAVIPKSKFPSGIVQFTLFSGSGQPLNERIAFIQRNADLLKLNVSASNSTSAPREKVKINLDAFDNTGQPVVGVFSAAVIDESKVPTDEAAETTILSQLLLTSDIKGYIEQPNYYFNNTSGNTVTDLDNLMLTQGYRRFEWSQIVNNQLTPVQFQAEKSLQISGTIKTSGGKTVPNSKVTLFTTAGGTFIIDTVADSQGRFAFKNLLFKDSIRFVLQARNAKGGKNVEIVLDKLPEQAVVKTRNVPAAQSTGTAALISYLKASKKKFEEEAKYGLGNHAIVLKEVVVTEKRKPAVTNSSNLNGAGNADQVITSELFDKLGCTTIDQCLQGRLLGVIFQGGIPYSTRSMNTPMQVIVDGIYVDGDYLSSIPPMNVSSVEVLRTIGNTAIYGSRGGGGVLIVNTKRGGEITYNASQLYSPGIVTYTPKGYYTARQFYAPKYDDPKTNLVVADLRSTIHWVPNILTNDKGNASFEYFNAGSKGTYRVVIEGLDSEGHLGRRVYRYQVQ